MSTYFPPKQITNGASSSLLPNLTYKKVYFNKVFFTSIESGRFLFEFKITKNNSRSLVPNLAAGRLRIAHSVLLNPYFKNN
jgi:hypothetical protein